MHLFNSESKILFKKSDLKKKRNRKKEDIYLKYLKDVVTCQNHWADKRSH
jgi:hypothetical protein